MKLRLLDAAIRDVAEAARYYDLQQAGLGDRLHDSVEAAFEQIESNPEGHSLLETFPPELGYRRVRLPPFRYIAIYRTRNDEAVVMAVVHTSRKPNFWLSRSE